MLDHALEAVYLITHLSARELVRMLSSTLVGVLLALAVTSAWQPPARAKKASRTQSASAGDDGPESPTAPPDAALLPCVRSRRSVFPRSYVDRAVERATVDRLLEAAMWAPYHGSRPPWRFVVLGRASMVEMQRMTLEYYDEHWRAVGWANGVRGTEAEYLKWRAMTEGEIDGRWGPVSFMIAIVMRRQAGSKRMPEWEEIAATACAVQNMHVQASASPGLACYWSSWHDAARDSDAMRAFLGMGAEDRCLGFFIVASCDPQLKDSRVRQPDSHLAVEWRE